VVHFPGDHGSAVDLDHEKFMGLWHVTHSTLPLWKSRKDVTISYALTPGSSSQAVQFDDIVQYRSRSAPSTSTPSRVVGVDTLFTPPSSDRPLSKTRYKWRGKGMLRIASSRWQVLGCNTDEKVGPAWAVTYFEKTLFTPEGLDVYSRVPEGLPDELLQDIIGKTKALGGAVGKLANDFFQVEQSSAPTAAQSSAPAS